MEILDRNSIDNQSSVFASHGVIVYTSPTVAETCISRLHDCEDNQKEIEQHSTQQLTFTADTVELPVTYIWIPVPLAPALVESTVVALVKQDERTSAMTEKLVAKDYVPSKAGRVADIIQLLAKEGLSIASRAKSGGSVKEVIEAPVEEVPIEKAPIVEAVATKG